MVKLMGPIGFQERVFKGCEPANFKDVRIAMGSLRKLDISFGEQDHSLSKAENSGHGPTHCKAVSFTARKVEPAGRPGEVLPLTRNSLQNVHPSFRHVTGPRKVPPPRGHLPMTQCRTWLRPHDEPKPPSRSGGTCGSVTEAFAVFCARPYVMAPYGN